MEDRVLRMEDRGLGIEIEDREWRMEDRGGRFRMEDGGLRIEIEDRGWQGRRTAISH
jgi:hypothetical protein